MAKEEDPSLTGYSSSAIRRTLILHLTPSDASLPRVISNLARKHVAIEELQFQSGTETHRLRLVVRASPAHLDHTTSVLNNTVVVVDLAVDPPITGRSDPAL